MHSTILDLLPAGCIDQALKLRLRVRRPSLDNIADQDGVVSCILLVRSNTLEIYYPQQGTVSGKGKVTLLNRHVLSARILEVARIPTHKHDHTNNSGTEENEEDSDRLLVAFANWHYSILAWDAIQGDWQTWSLHNFNRPEYQNHQITPIPLIGRLLAVDPAGRCALVRVNTGRWATLPLDPTIRSRLGEWSEIEGIIIERNDGNEPGSSSINEPNGMVKHILDWCFLPDFMEPTLAILFEPSPTWPYRLPMHKDTVSVIIGTLTGVISPTVATGNINTYSFDARPRITPIAQYHGLASDSRRLWAASMATQTFQNNRKKGSNFTRGKRQGSRQLLRGVFISGANTLIHIEPGNPVVCALPLNSYITSRMTGLRRSTTILSLTLEQGHWFEWAGRTWICSDQGQIYSLHMIGETANRRLDLIPAHREEFQLFKSHRILRVIPLNEDEDNDDSILFFQTLVADAYFYNVSKIVEFKSLHSNQYGRQTRSSNSMDFEFDNRGDEEEEEEDIYGEGRTVKPITNATVQIQADGQSDIEPIKLIATIPVLAPLCSFCIGGEKEGRGERGPWTIITTFGDGREGRLAIFPHVLPIKSQPVLNSQGCREAWNLGSGRYLISQERSSLVLERGNSRSGSSVTLPLLPGRTIFASSLSEERGIIQLTNEAIRVMVLQSKDQTEWKYCDQNLPLYSPPKRAILVRPFLVVEHEDRQLTIYSLNISDTNADSNMMEELSLRPLPWHCNQPIVAWDLFTQSTNRTDTTVFFVFFTQDGRLSIIDLHRQRVEFSSCRAGQLPMIMSHEGEDQEISNNENSDVIGGPTTIVDLKILISSSSSLDNNSDSEVYLILTTICTMGVTVYRQVGNCFIKQRWGINMICPVLGLIKGGGSTLKRITSDRLWLCNDDRLFWVNLSELGEVTIQITPFMMGANPCDGAMITTGKGLEEVALLDTDCIISYSRPYLVKNFKGESIRTIVYHAPSDTYAALFISLRDWSLPRDDHTPISDNLDMAVPVEGEVPQQYVYTLRLFSPRTWTTIDEFTLTEDEYALCLNSVTLETKQTASGRQPFLVLGTSTCRGEDRPARGRLLVFDVISVVPEEGRIESDRKLKLLVDEEVKGPVTAISHINGSLLVAVGPKVIIYSFEDNESLTGVAFADVGVYGSCLSSLKNFFTVGDVCKSLGFYAFQVKPPKIVNLARDFLNRPIMSLEYILNNKGQMIVIAAEPAQSSHSGPGLVHLLTYDPVNKASQGGQRLISLGTFCLPSEVISMKRVVLGDESQACILGEVSGAFSIISSTDEMTFRGLVSMQLCLATTMPYLGGQTIRSSRQAAKLTYRPYSTPKNLLDATGRGLIRFWELPVAARRILVERQVGSRLEKTEQLLESLLQSVYRVFI